MKTMPQKIRHWREQIFADVLTRQGLEFFYQPAMFHVDSIGYRPDFYVPIQRTFYEVVGTRQAYCQNRQKIRLIKKAYPFLKIRVVNPDGTPYSSQSPKVKRPPIPKVNLQYLPRNYNLCGYRGLDLERRRQGMMLKELERRTNLKAPQIYRLTYRLGSKAPQEVVDVLANALNRSPEYIRFLINHYPTLEEVEKYEKEHPDEKIESIKSYSAQMP